jgi:outer membrane protein assembly factor BamA
LNFSINSNSTNDIYYPTSGIVNNLSFVISPTRLSDNTYYKLRYDYSIFIDNESNDNFYFISSKLGFSDAFKGNLKTSNTFSLGGSNFQGFDYRGIGQFNNSTYLGGNKFFTFTAGLGSNLLFDKKDNIYFKTFLSTGSIWDSDYANNDDIKLRSSLGFSLDFIASSIPVTFTYALPIQKELNDKTRLFSFAIGTSF